MDLLIKSLLFVHFIGLAIGMGSGIALSNAGRISADTKEPVEQGMARLTAALRQNSHVGLVLLWVSGLLMVWLKYGGVAGLGLWFWVKMAAVVGLSAAVGMATANYKKLRAGEQGAAEKGKRFSMAAGLFSILAVGSAVMAFN
ncbi:hypothetical protein [Pelagibacterium montanilacus]|uniref:hypothetical protein n=1 Tax=Pelagibacterium montanilacus TaxID=2185280 RepID=UPI000F8E6993|nr:hypothetical protein [Pelagibacterium montanilacus]